MPVFSNFTKRSMAEMGGDSSAMKRQFYRDLSSLGFQQMISRYALMEPTVVKQYYPLADSLVIALLWTPPSRRNSTAEWNPSDR